MIDETLGIPNEHFELLAALALQCFNNEYVFNIDFEETQAVGRLASAVCECVAREDERSRADLESQVIALTCYVPLASLQCARELAASNTTGWCPISQKLLVRTLLEPLEERAIDGEIDSLGPVANRTSMSVRAQYEENPYPRWLNVGDFDESDLISTLRARFPLFTPPDSLRGDARILIAGCGTGEEAIRFAAANRDSEVVAVDLSRRSLAYAVRMARMLRIDNVRFLQGDILDLEKLGGRFHVISSVGVLHHLADPLAGWRMLTDMLAPSGLMRVALYSERARRPLTVARDEIEWRGFKPVAEDIRKFRSLVLSGAINGGLAELSTGREFYSLSDFRDLLFHVQEHRFTPAQISEVLSAMGLELIGFDLSNLNIPQSAIEVTRHDRKIADFAACERIEELYPRAFLSMYRFWCRKS
jgi:2-polyprenyl-3-methyl-5-hydroxy-6-metoxy-1,4-benzoquinol methylase